MSDREIFLNAPENATPEALAQYIEEACGGDAELRVRVEALFAASSNMENAFLGNATPDGEHDTVIEFPSTEGEGTVIGRYKLLQKIGEGGMGDVWMAEQREPITRKVALKVIKAGMDTKEVLARFEAERQALALMNHPHIAQVLDAEATELGRPYFVMELVQGVPITEYCDQRKLTTEERLELFVQVCDAVQHAHQKGVIHRDIKPTNVMATNHDGKPHVKVIDFGVAKATSQKLTERTLFTRYGQMVGTPAYMSPEQAEFTNDDVDTRSDIYSLGCLLYELLTGAPPFDPTRLRSMAFDELCRVIREEEPQRPSTRISTLEHEKLAATASLHDIDSERLSKKMRGDLDWIAMQALEKNRARRYQTARDFALDVKRYLANEPVNAATFSAKYRIRKFVAKHKPEPSHVFAAALGLVIFILVFNGVVIDSPLAVRGELDLGDFLTDNRGGGTVDDSLVLIGIDKGSIMVLDVLDEDVVVNNPVLDEMSFGYPFPRTIYAVLMEKLVAAGARLVIFDVVFKEEQQDDADFYAVLAANPGRFVLGQVVSDFNSIDDLVRKGGTDIDGPSPSIAATEGAMDQRMGYANLFSDLDGRVRSITPTYRRFDHPGWPVHHSMAYAALKQLGSEERIHEPDRVYHMRFPNFSEVSPPYPVIDMYSLFVEADWEKKYGGGEAFKDKIVFIGGTSIPHFHDVVTIPGGNILGVQLQMNALDAALNGQFYDTFSRFHLICSIVLMAILALCIARIMRKRPLIGLGILIGCCALYLLAVRWVYFSFDWLLPSFSPFVTLAVCGVLSFCFHTIRLRLRRHEKAEVA